MVDYNERRLRLAKTLFESPKRREAPVGFNMGHWLWLDPTPDDGGFGMDKSGHSCGTVACMAGHAVIQMYMDEGLAPNDAIERAKHDAWDDSVPRKAREYLGVNYDQSEDLFCMANTPAHMQPVTPRQAADVLRRLVRTGEVDWSPVARAQGREWNR